MSHLSGAQKLAYVLDQLDDTSQAAADLHVQDCAACHADLAVLAQTELHLRDLPAISQAPGSASPVGEEGRRSWLRRLVAAGGVLAAAAAITLLIPTAALPEYDLTLQPAAASLRSAAQPLVAGAPLEILLRPASSAPPPQVWLYAGRSGDWRPLDGTIERAPSGSVRAIVAAPEAPGTHTILAVLAPAGASTMPLTQVLDNKPLPPGWQRLEEEVWFQPSP
ncbi:MAG: hypothetical protein ACI8S6_002180 [Myxococcota bacterium]|jgi:hypothetical protein